VNIKNQFYILFTVSNLEISTGLKFW